jgi:hypothetical protein
MSKDWIERELEALHPPYIDAALSAAASKPLSPHATLLAMHDGIDAGRTDDEIVADILAKEGYSGHVEEYKPLRVWDVTLTCDHKMLVISASPIVAMKIADDEARTHNAKAEGVVEVDLSKQGLLAWYPGPFSVDAVTE